MYHAKAFYTIYKYLFAILALASIGVAVWAGVEGHWGWTGAMALLALTDFVMAGISATDEKSAELWEQL